jgi:hypothetical protein
MVVQRWSWVVQGFSPTMTIVNQANDHALLLFS